MKFYFLLLAIFPITNASDGTRNSSISPSISFLEIFDDNSDGGLNQLNFGYFVEGHFDYDFFNSSSPLSVNFEQPEKSNPTETCISADASANFYSENNLKSVEPYSASKGNSYYPHASLDSSADLSSSLENETISSELDDEDSSSDFGSQKTKNRLLKRKILPSKNRSRSPKSKMKAETLPETSSASKKSLEKSSQNVPKRTKFCHRSPFLYGTICPCESRTYYNYISSALKHMTAEHGHVPSKKVCFFDVVELIDDFGVIEEYPLTCELCPFRTNRNGYLANHKFYNHNMQRSSK